jgi:hypothetical protein
MAAPGLRRGTPPPFPWPALWAQVAAQGGEVYGQRWLVPRGAHAPPPAARPATADPARHLVFARGEAEEELEDAALDEDSDDADSEEGEGGPGPGEGSGSGSGSLDALSLHLDGEGEIVVTDEWRDRLARAAGKHAQRVAAAARKEACEDASEDSREDAREDAREGPPDALGDSGGVAAREAAAAAASGPTVSSPARSVPAGGVAKAAEAPYDRFLRGKYGSEQARRFAVQEAALSAALASRGGGQQSGLAYWPK